MSYLIYIVAVVGSEPFVNGGLPQLSFRPAQSFLQGLWNAWIGLSDHHTEGQWIWESRCFVNYNNWNSGEPNGYIGENCVEVIAGDKRGWNDRNCSVRMPGVCKKPVRCEAGWTLREQSCYKLTEYLSWNEARQQCLSMNAYLTDVHDVREQDNIYSVIQQSHGGLWGAWIGLSDQQTEGQWIWESGWPLNYSNWNRGEPNGYTGENCVEVIAGDKLGWNDQNCSSRIPGVCKKREGAACPAGPPIITGYDETPLEPHATVRLVCRSRPARPDSRLMWSRNGEPVTGAESTRLNTPGDFVESTLLLTGAEYVAHGSVYICRLSSGSREVPSANVTLVLKVHGGWSNWNQSSPCSVTCGGGGTDVYKRRCENPKPQRGGKQCEGPATEVRSCSAPPCPTDICRSGYWGMHGEWCFSFDWTQMDKQSDGRLACPLTEGFMVSLYDNPENDFPIFN